MPNFGFEKLSEQAIECAMAEIDMATEGFRRTSTLSDSPIERLLYCALHLHLKFSSQEWFERLLKG